MFIVMTKTSFIDYMKNILKVNKIQNKTPYSQAGRKLHIRLCSFTVTLQVSHMEQALLNLPEHLSSHWIFSGVRIARSLVFCVVVLHIVIFGNFIVDLWLLTTPFVSSKLVFLTMV